MIPSKLPGGRLIRVFLWLWMLTKLLLSRPLRRLSSLCSRLFVISDLWCCCRVIYVICACIFCLCVNLCAVTPALITACHGLWHSSRFSMRTRSRSLRISSPTQNRSLLPRFFYVKADLSLARSRYIHPAWPFCYLKPKPHTVTPKPSTPTSQTPYPKL